MYELCLSATHMCMYVRETFDSSDRGTKLSRNFARSFIASYTSSETAFKYA